jgi:DNA polymerase-3 subunit gamma/tau
MTLLRLHAFTPERAGAARPAPKPLPRHRCANQRAAAPVACRARPDAVPPAPTSAPAAKPSAAACTTDADWHALAGLPLPGMARKLAQHCELVERRSRRAPAPDAGPQAPARCLSRKSCRPSCANCWGATCASKSTVAEPAGETPAARRQNSERERQDRAIASIEQDPFVRDVVDLFDASIDESTIKPV